MRAFPLSVFSASATTFADASGRMPVVVAFAVGTRKVILSCSKEIT